MPSDWTGRRSQPRRKTLADLLRELQASPGGSRPATSTSPVAGPGRIRELNTAARNRESEVERRQRMANEALRRLKEL